MLGSYFGSTKIVQGAGGLGADGPLIAFADGVVGGSAIDAEMPGPLQAFHDGALGADGPLMAYADGVVGGSSMDPEMPGPLQAFRDGALGDESTPNTYQGDTPISVHNDGVLGPHYEGMSTFGPLQSFHDGSLGADAPTALSGAALDLANAAALTEVKMLVAYSSGGYALSPEAQTVYTPEWYTSGVWEPTSSALWQYVVSTVPAFSGKEVSGTAGSQSYPNGTGIAYLYSMLAAPAAGSMGPVEAAKLFPLIASWFNNKGTAVLAPYLTLGEKTAGHRADAQAGMSMSKMAMWGLGAAALLGVALVLRKKK